jgi:hypothetical protein
MGTSFLASTSFASTGIEFVMGGTSSVTGTGVAFASNAGEDIAVLIYGFI